MQCEVCGSRTEDGTTLVRRSGEGYPGTWRCLKHDKGPVDANADTVVTIVEGEIVEDLGDEC